MKKQLAFAGVVIAGLVVTMAAVNAQRPGGLGPRGGGHGSILGSGVVPGGGERRSHSGPTVISIRRILLLCML